ncbi:MAG: hypothetical protein DMG17_27195 [Acidobacteria bacterium]|nr:MAG: hypothetical protein DMG17_27195 [Acidobacteriota bacterium]
MRAEERPDGVALPARGLDFFLDSAAVAIFFVPRWFRRGRCFRGSRIVFRFVTSGPIPEKFSMYSNTSQFFENAKPGWMREKDERSKLAERRSRKMRWRIEGLI